MGKNGYVKNREKSRATSIIDSKEAIDSHGVAFPVESVSRAFLRASYDKTPYCLVTNMVGMFLDLMDDIVDSTTALCPATFDCPSTLKPQPLSRNYVIFSRDPRPRIHRALASSF